MFFTNEQNTNIEQWVAQHTLEKLRLIVDDQKLPMNPQCSMEVKINITFDWINRNRFPKFSI